MSELLHYRKLVLVIFLVAISFPRVIETEECDVKEIGTCFHPGTYCYETRFERILKCEREETYHCAYNQVYGHLVEACAKRIQCGKGKEPWIQYLPENIVEIVCHYCRNYEKKYNPESNRWSDEYYECDYDKDVCLPNENKIRCSLENEVDKYTKNRRCRCDVKKGYRIDKNYPEDKHACTDDVGWGCILAYCYKNENEDVLLMGYKCASKCPAGFNRSDEKSDECLPIPTSTTQKPTSALSVPSSQKTKQDTTGTTKSTTPTTTPTTTSAPLPPYTDGKTDAPPEGSDITTMIVVVSGAFVGFAVVSIFICCKKKGWTFDMTKCPPCRRPRPRAAPDVQYTAVTTTVTLPTTSASNGNGTAATTVTTPTAAAATTTTTTATPSTINNSKSKIYGPVIKITGNPTINVHGDGSNMQFITHEGEPNDSDGDQDTSGTVTPVQDTSEPRARARTPAGLSTDDDTVLDHHEKTACTGLNRQRSRTFSNSEDGVISRPSVSSSQSYPQLLNDNERKDPKDETGRKGKTQNGNKDKYSSPAGECELLHSHDDLDDETKKAMLVKALNGVRSTLVKEITPVLLLDELVTNGVITDTEARDISQRVSSSPSDMNREIIDKTRARGWCDYLKFKECLREVGAEYCIKQLQKEERKYREQLDQGEGSHRGDVSLDGIDFMDDDPPSETSSHVHGSHDNMEDEDATNLTNEQEEKIALDNMQVLSQITDFTEFIETACKMEVPKLLRQHLLIPGSQKKDYSGCPDDYQAYSSSGSGNNCLYQSVSLLLDGDEMLQHRLRLAAVLYAAKYFQAIVTEFAKRLEGVDVWQFFLSMFSNATSTKDIDERMSAEALIPACLQKIIMETTKAGTDSCQMHVYFLSQALKRSIFACSQRDLDKLIDTSVDNAEQDHLFIMWVNYDNDPSGPPNHVVPLVRKSAIPDS